MRGRWREKRIDRKLQGSALLCGAALSFPVPPTFPLSLFPAREGLKGSEPRPETE